MIVELQSVQTQETVIKIVLGGKLFTQFITLFKLISYSKIPMTKTEFEIV